jgi:nicotinamidase-related amidase|uniref:Isochorismatase-like domain-containing protein n=1 Tax=Rhodococcus sp. Mel TaxID=1093626 RepID=H8ZKS9_9NOCA|nr:hypothetical protein [Rhodococcus sp. Mel]
MNTAATAFLNAVEACEPALVGMVTARDQLSDGSEITITHAGPPVETILKEGPLFGAVVGGLLHEGWNIDDAREAASSSTALDLRPNQDNGRAAPLAGVITPSMPLFVVHNQATGTSAHSPINEGSGAVLRFGAYSPDVVDRLAWLRNVAGPTLGRALDEHGPISLRHLVAGGLRNGDELHNRTNWTTGSFVSILEPALRDAGPDGHLVADFLRDNSFTFLNVSVAFAKCVLDAAGPTAPSGVVLAMASNGERFGMKVAGAGPGWVTTAAPAIRGRLALGSVEADASPLLGDSGTIEALGLGGLALSTAPEIAPFLGCDIAELDRRSRAGRASTIGEHRTLQLADNRGAPLGLDVTRALASSVAPTIDAGIAHHLAGIGQIGAGLAEIPREALQQAHSQLRAPHNNERNITMTDRTAVAPKQVFGEDYFTINAATTALLVIDMQNSFVAPGAVFEAPKGREIIPNIDRLIGEARLAGAPVIWTQSDHSPPAGGRILDRHPVIKFTPELWIGDPSFDLYPEMEQPLDTEHRVVKHKYDAFHETDLDRALRNLGCDTVIIVGVATEICCESTARAAFFNDYNVVFVRDATAAFDPAIQDDTCNRMDAMFGRAMTTEDVIADLGGVV